MIQDSGNRTEFDSGAVRDVQKGKGRCDLLPLDFVARCLKREDKKEFSETLDYIDVFMKDGDPQHLIDAVAHFVYSEGAFGGCMCTAMLEYAVHLEEGAEKYGDRNWQKGIPVRNYINSAVRHYLKYRRGDMDERHDRAFVWNAVCGAFTAETMPELNEYPVKIK